MKYRTLVFSLLILGLGGYGLAFRPTPQVRAIPGSVTSGLEVLQAKGCLDCHSLNGTGGNRAPDLALGSRDAGTPSRLASALWNHSPRMWKEYEAAGRPLPSLTQNEVADLYSYFFAAQYFEPLGNAQRGRSVFIGKGCAGCHSEVLNAGALDSYLNRWKALRDPTGWADRFWNHANEMFSAANLRGVAWPELSERDAADLMSFIANLGGVSSEGPTFSIGDPLTGRNVFERSCQSCHTFGPGDGSKVDLLEDAERTSLAGYIAAMWNHAPEMRRLGRGTAVLAPGEMPDVIAFLFLQQYFYEDGDAARGRRVYESKGCNACHDGQRADGAPDLAQSAQPHTPITMTAAVWRHGPAMAEAVRLQGRAWPQFQRSEMADILTYLNSRLRPQVAATQN